MATKRTLWERIYFEEAYTETARLIGYSGVEQSAFWEAAQALSQRHGKPQMMAAVYDLTRRDKREADPSRYEFTAEARRWMFGLLGPAEDHPDYAFIKHGPVLAFREDIQKWKADFAAKQAAEKPPEPVKEEPKPAAAKEKPLDPPPADEADDQEEAPAAIQPGISPAGYAADAKRRNHRQLHCMLRDARQKLKHHGKRSFAGKEAKKALAAAEAELRYRGIELPPVGEETAKWDKVTK